MTLFEHIPHPHIATRAQTGPVTVADQHATGTAAQRFNTRLALWTTRVVGTMWCAYAFAALDLLALPEALRGGLFGIVQWLASFFLQLVLLSIIMVGQDVQAKAADARAEATYRDTEALLDSLAQVAQHLSAQDEVLRRLTSSGGVTPGARHQLGAVQRRPDEGLNTPDVKVQSPDERDDPAGQP